MMNSNIELDLQIELMIDKNEGLWQCKMCGNLFSGKQVIQIHAETHIEGLTHSCHICDKTFPARNNLRNHINSFHCELTFKCNVCGKSGMKKSTFYVHKSKGCKVSAN